MAAKILQTQPVQPVYQEKSPTPPPQSPDTEPTSPVPKPKRRGLPKTLLFVVGIIIFLGVAAFVFSLVQDRISNNEESATKEAAGPTEHEFEEYPNFAGIPINENTISFVKADGKFCLLYKGKVYLPQDTGSLEPRVKDATEEMLAFPWLGLVDAPDNITGDEIYSFRHSPSNKSFVFITRWTMEEGEKFHMFRFNNDNISQLRVFDEATDGLFHAPKINIFSPGGNFLNLSMFRCAGCLNEHPETLLYYIPTAETRNIGKVSEFSWGADDNTYNYRQFEEGVNPATMPLRTNEFFEQSIELLTPN